MNKTKFSHKIIAVFLTLNFLTTIIPVNQIFAGNNGPNAPEASGFEPVGATDMVNLSSGDMSYVLPLLEVDGFPVTLSYHAGIPMDMEASWVGLGWNINTGAIARGVVANPDDWGIGRRLNLTYLYGEIDSYSVNVGVGIAKAAEVGVGLSWGSNKSISGSVSASVGPASASIDTNGNYSLGVSASTAMEKFGFGGAFDKITSGDSKNGFGGSLSISGNTKEGGVSANIGVGGSANGLSAGMGVSISDNGIGSSFSVGANNKKTGGDTRSGGASISMNSFSAGDYSYNTKGLYIPLQIGIFSFGFGHQKTEIKLAKGFNKYGYGSLYQNMNSLYNTNLGQDVLPFNTSNDDLQRRNTYGDVYEQALPQSEEEFIGDYRNQVEKLNFTFGGYDSYDINASGLGGALRPIIGENSVLIGEGYDGESIRTDREKTKVFYHNSRFNLKPSKSLNVSPNSSTRLNFSFDGQITEDAVVTGTNIINYNGSVLDITNFVSQGTTLASRPKSGSFVETFTNSEIDLGADIMIPASLKTANGSISRVNAGYIMDGIGGYKITTPDGKTYHFSQPVYQYEQVQHNFLNFDADNTSKFNSSSKREATPYATHWLLTAITGPDFVDMNNNKFADEDDFGYWVRLDHGQWSNAFTWRSPYDTKKYTDDGGFTLPNQSKKHYSTFIDKEVEKSDPGYFIQGRKDLYYLDKIVSKNQTAVFVKDLRQDAFGTSADYVFKPTNTSNIFTQPTATQFNDPIETQHINAEENAKYDKEYQLRLDKIIILNKKESEVSVDKTAGNGILAGVNQFISQDNRYYSVGSGSFFFNNLPPESRIHKLHLSNNIIDVNDVQNFDYSQVAKVIKFNHSYDLARKTPSSGYTNSSAYPNNGAINPYYGRLTLNSIKTYGRGMVPNANENQLYDYMPPYSFEYKNTTAVHEENEIIEIYQGQSNPLFPGKKQYKLDRANKDNWGFRGNNIDAWSLNKITTPQGATIEVNYEEDDFYVEAFGRRYWENNLKIYADTSVSSQYTLFYIENQDGTDPLAEVDFTDYFQTGDELFFDYWVSRRRKHSITGHNHWGAIDVNSDASVVKTIVNVNTNRLTVKVDNSQQTSDSCNGSNLIVGCHGNDGKGRVKNRWFCKTDGCGSHKYYGDQRCSIPSASSVNDDHHKMKYKLLATKVAPGTSGGGLRVKEIIVKDNSGSKYITRYDYNNPFKGRTSGITSFNPIRGEVFVPYQNELPGPGVMYEWVTMKAIEVDNNDNEKEVQSTRYHYYTLKPVYDIFNPNIDMKDIDGESIFKAEVLEIDMNYDDLTAKDMKIEKNLTKIGQLISIEEFNGEGHLMSKTYNSYQPRVGELSETFSSMKSVYDFNENNDHEEVSFRLHQRYLSLSSKSEKVSVVNSIENITSAGKSVVTYSEPDEYLGTYTASLKTLSDGTLIKEKKVPAYTKYPMMGSKISDYNNKNMLTQEAMNVTRVSTNGGNSWNTLNTSLSTWNDDWSYRDNLGNESNPVNEVSVWRKHKTFVWKDDVGAVTGHYLTPVNETNDYFNWGTGTPTSTKWQNVSEITRYTHWSSPVETRDINNNFESSKMADNFSKVIAGSNARYSEMYYSGAEYIATGNTFEGEVQGANYQTNEVSHTGDYAVKNNNANDKVFSVSGLVGSGHNDTTKDFRPGKYKVSFWSHKQIDVDNAAVKLNNSSVPVSETVEAGCWKQFNYYIDLSANSSFELFVTNTSGGGFYFDDFRMHPVYASMNSFVYDKNTDELLYILDANNMSTAYRYDDAGRLKTSYKEVEDTHEFDGGFKIVQQYKYHYQNVDSTVTYNEDINNCIDQSYPPLTLKGLARDCIPEFNPYDIKYAMHVYGGSGNYKYEWQWLTNAETGQYSDWAEGGLYQYVPYAPKYCNQEFFNKQWLVNARVTDLTTGEIINSNDDYLIEGCTSYISNSKVLLGVEASQCHDKCHDSKYQFHMYALDGNLELPHPTSYIDNNTGLTVNLDLAHGDGLFCPSIKYVETSSCESGYIEYVSVTPNYPGATGYTYEFYLDCVTPQNLELNPELKIGVSNDPKYANPGTMILKIEGEIISVSNIKDIKK